MSEPKPNNPGTPWRRQPHVKEKRNWKRLEQWGRIPPKPPVKDTQS